MKNFKILIEKNNKKDNPKEKIKFLSKRFSIKVLTIKNTKPSRSISNPVSKKDQR